MSKITDIYGMARGWMDHPQLKEKQYDKRSAWAWLIENAAWKEHRKAWRGDRPPIDLRRGQLLAAIRVMADEWGWSKDRVERFLKNLKNASMIEVDPAPGICLITICNYDDYQLTPRYSKDADKDADKDAGKDADKDADKDNKNKVNKVNKEKNKDNNITPTPQGGEVDQPALIKNLPLQPKEPCRFESDFWPTYPRREGKQKAKEAYDRARERDTQDNILAGVRAFKRQYLADERPDKDRFLKYPQGWLNDSRWKDFTEKKDYADDDDALPDFKKMTPAEHARWVLRRAGME